MGYLDSKIDLWKSKLLDLSKRNRLLNYKKTKRSTLLICNPLMFDLWKRVVVDEVKVTFPYFDEDSVQEGNIWEDAEVTGDITSDMSTREMQKTLWNLRQKTKTALEEQGVNILYLSFGFLDWREDAQSDQSFLAPLVLVPVKLTVEKINSPYVMELHEDEITINPTLVHKLLKEFGIELPSFSDEDNLSGYLLEVEAAIKHTQWKVVYESSLSLLSFLKINMYKDLENNKEKIISNKIVCAINGDSSKLEPVPEWINGYDHDRETKAVDLFQVVDADSSQQDAITMAKHGISFVLQGPPGTGKSQTITNIIAECLAAGKKVLFVSEKMAALEVVKKRLTSSHLNEFCLTLHSNKTSKKDVLNQLSVIMNLSDHKASLRLEAYENLERLQESKEKLNEYSKQLSTVVKPLEKTIFQVNGILANLESKENLVFDIADVETTTPQLLNRYVNLLSQYSSTFGRMSGNLHDNPWYGSTVQTVTNELRHNIGFHLPALLSKIKPVTEIFEQLQNDLNFSYNQSFDSVTDILEILSLASKSPKAPSHWIWRQDLMSLKNDINSFHNDKLAYHENFDGLRAADGKLKSGDSRIKLPTTLLYTTSDEIAGCIETVNNILNADDCFKTWQELDKTRINIAFDDLSVRIESIVSAQKYLFANYEKVIADVDYKPIVARFRTIYGSFFKIFYRQYWADRRLFKGFCKNAFLKVNEKEIKNVLSLLGNIDDANVWLTENRQSMEGIFGKHFDGNKTAVQSLRKTIDDFLIIMEAKAKLVRMREIKRVFEANDARLRQNFDFLYNGIDTDWDKVSKSLDWAESFCLCNKKYQLNKLFIENVCSDDYKIQAIPQFKTKLESAVSCMETEFNWYLSLFENTDEIVKTPMPMLAEKVSRGMDNLSLLEEWIDYRSSRTACRDTGLGEFIDMVEERNIEACDVVPIFRKRFFRLWLDKILPQFPAVLEFRRRKQDGLVDEFASLDTLQFKIAIDRIRAKLIESLPSFDRIVTGIDEISILRRELAKQRRIMPIRKLFKAIPNLLPKLKPCLMMSPLSVSLFLESDCYEFDTVIFDEASQICTENAIGAVWRGKQVILVGDSKQLPPTSFFNTSTSDADYDSDTVDDENTVYPDDYESILDEAEASSMPKRGLRWHYRSRNEELIAFSNKMIYDNKLVTFPSNADKVPGNGVEYIYLESGIYDRGGKKGNQLEAEQVADLVFEHFRKNPNRSLGVIAFGEVQQQAIESAIRRRRKLDLSFEEFFKEDKEEPFFIKNLENVQGDERNSIIFSIGYAKDSTGKFPMNFGPLNRIGGHRRLNVAITRAKHNIKIVGSILPAEIDVGKTSQDGPKLLKAYIEYARNGIEAIFPQIQTNSFVQDQSFELAVCDFLERNGFIYDTKAGCSEYRIDIAVKHPTKTDRYVLGIECDGDTYYSTKTARERDRLRREVLENLGWTIYRVWSTDWIKDSKIEGQKLLEAISKAISEAPPQAFGEDEPEQNSNHPVEFLNIEQKPALAKNPANVYGFGCETVTSFANLPKDSYGYLSLGDCIKAIVTNEFPVHYDLVCKKISPLLGNQKSTSKIRREVDYALSRMRGVIRKGDFFYPEGSFVISPKAVGNTRDVCHISPDEIAQAMKMVVSQSIGISRESLMQVVSREYGFTRLSDRIQEAMEQAIDVLLESGKAKELDGKILTNGL